MTGHGALALPSANPNADPTTGTIAATAPTDFRSTWAFATNPYAPMAGVGPSAHTAPLAAGGTTIPNAIVMLQSSAVVGPAPWLAYSPFPRALRLVSFNVDDCLERVVALGDGDGV